MATVCAFQHDQYFMVSGNCMIRKELLQLYKRIQEEIYDSLDATRTQMLTIYRELLEKYAGKLNTFCGDLHKGTLTTSDLRKVSVSPAKRTWCIGQHTNSFGEVSNEIEIIKESLNRYLQKAD